MGEIINTKNSSDKIICEILLNEKETFQLKSHFKNAYLFSPELCNLNAKIIERGHKKSTKYFLIPFNLRPKKTAKYHKISYNKIETDKKIFYICTAEKDFLS
jgi:hypothetical protein